MQFRLTSLLWVSTLLATALGALGAGGVLAFGTVFFARSIWSQMPPKNVRGCLVAVGVLLLAIVLLLPAVQAPRGDHPAWLYGCNELKSLALAFHNFESQHQCLPPATLFGEDGEPLLSWRALILEFTHEQHRYAKLRLDEPWDSAWNVKATHRTPDVFGGYWRDTAGCTVYKLVTGPQRSGLLKSRGGCALPPIACQTR
ncbi:MAG: DUF1559 domain-containing protein [Planctomycetota bacterium]